MLKKCCFYAVTAMPNDPEMTVLRRPHVNTAVNH